MPVPPIHLITPVWGEAYTRCFLDVALPTLLASGNLPAFGPIPGSLYHIVTTDADRARIEASKVFARLRGYVPVKFTIIPPEIQTFENRHELQSYCYRQGVADADALDAAVIFMNPDIVFADGAMASLIRIVESGKRSIEVLGLRLVKEVVVPHLMQHHSSADGSIITISPRQLMTLAMNNLHPITRAHLYHSEGEGLHPSGLMWRVGKEGLIARCFHLHPIFVHARTKNATFTTTVDDDYVQSAQSDPQAAHVVVDSDEFCLCELSDTDRQVESMLRPPESDKPRVIAQWALFNAKPRHSKLLQHRILMHTGPTNSRAWKAAKKESDRAITRVLRQLNNPLQLGLSQDEIKSVLQRRGLTEEDLQPPPSLASRWISALRGYITHLIGGRKA